MTSEEAASYQAGAVRRLAREAAQLRDDLLEAGLCRKEAAQVIDHAVAVVFTCAREDLARALAGDPSSVLEGLARR